MVVTCQGLPPLREKPSHQDAEIDRQTFVVIDLAKSFVMFKLKKRPGMAHNKIKSNPLSKRIPNKGHNYTATAM